MLFFLKKNNGGKPSVKLVGIPSYRAMPKIRALIGWLGTGFTLAIF
jgi:hypothetical protein